MAKKKVNTDRTHELVKLANKTIEASEKFLQILKNPDATREQIEAAAKAATEAAQKADKELDTINKKPEER